MKNKKNNIKKTIEKNIMFSIVFLYSNYKKNSLHLNRKRCII